jgi:CRP-like cAMP-binding protein
MQLGHPHSRLITRLSATVGLSEQDRNLISGLPMHVRNVPADHDIVRQGQVTGQCCLLLDGFLFRYKEGSDGRRQILSFYVPGDIPDLHSMHLGPMDHNLASVGAAVVAFIAHSALFEIIAVSPALNHTFMREMIVDASIQREWLLNIGTRQALPRAAHLICEIAARLKAVGLARDLNFSWPVSQADIADACGISTVHANRVVQEMRARGLIEWRGRALRILDWDELASVGDFTTDYLYLNNKSGASIASK